MLHILYISEAPDKWVLYKEDKEVTRLLKKEASLLQSHWCKLLRTSLNFSWQQWSSKREQSERVPKAPET